MCPSSLLIYKLALKQNENEKPTDNEIKSMELFDSTPNKTEKKNTEIIIIIYYHYLYLFPYILYNHLFVIYIIERCSKW